jgi:peroxiredoxin
MSSSMRPVSSSAVEYNHLLNVDLSKLDIEVFVTDDKSTRTVKLSEEFQGKSALVIVQPGASTNDEAANWLPKNWKEIEGAAGCGAQIEGFRDNLQKFPNRKLYVLNTKLNHADVITEKSLKDVVFIHATAELLAALGLTSDKFTFTAVDPKLEAEKMYLRRVNFVVDYGVITKALTTKNPKENANEMLCQLNVEPKQESVYQSGSSALYHASTQGVNTTSEALLVKAPIHSPRSLR